MFDKIALLFIGGCVTYLIQQYRAETSEELVQINEHIKDIEKFADMAEKYWASDFDDFEEDKMIAARISAAHASLSKFYHRISNYCDGQKYEYQRLFSSLWKKATSGDFESKGRTKDVVRAADILEISYELIHVLRMVRPDVISVRRMVMRFVVSLFSTPSQPWLNHT
ncbi:hypothetical protein [Brucella pseudintermedia]|uniref:hypothetical protein n=1 Tax=Brucella pseudintermedia TaxID=370111 RepID=UPI00124ED9E4|nr:hypothetical protein [Brucella pseudintermedia]KAB2682943.1 hypothetical protein F9K78_08350 [Brucella pseudintermedia]